VEVVASLSQGRTVAAQCGLFTHKSVPVIFEPPCIYMLLFLVVEMPLVDTSRSSGHIITKIQLGENACAHTKKRKP